jgi:hypothetical protein
MRFVIFRLSLKAWKPQHLTFGHRSRPGLGCKASAADFLTLATRGYCFP